MNAIQIAREFSAALRGQLAPAVMAKIVEFNRVNRVGTCATHNYLDANEVMGEIMEKHGLNPNTDHGAALWNEAWSVARCADFKPDFIEKGQQVWIRPDRQDPGDEKFQRRALENESMGRVLVATYLPDWVYLTSRVEWAEDLTTTDPVVTEIMRSADLTNGGVLRDVNTTAEQRVLLRRAGYRVVGRDVYVPSWVPERTTPEPLSRTAPAEEHDYEGAILAKQSLGGI